MNLFKTPSPIQELHSQILKDKKLRLFVKRDDLIHPYVSGNKWRKLKYNIAEAKLNNINTILTFGGAYSNHIAATAEVGKLLNINTIGIIRGDEGFTNKTLERARKNGMDLVFISREEYRKKNDADFISKLVEKYGKFYLIPEGGANGLGVKGCEEIIAELQFDFDYTCCSAGTGTTVAGISRQLKNNKNLLIFPALKGGEFILKTIEKYCKPEALEKVLLKADYHFGGYGKTTPELFDFMQKFKEDFDIELDKIYTAKLFFGVFDLIKNNFFIPHSKILVIHTGGLQGN